MRRITAKKYFIVFAALLTAIYTTGAAKAAVSPGANEAVFYFSPEDGTYESGQSFSVNLRIGASENITSVKSYLDFDSPQLSVINIATTTSVFSYWWEKSHNNTTGRIQLQASVPAPGFSGDGLLAVITFKADSSGEAGISHNSNSLALKPNDENILNLSRSTEASFTVPFPDTAPPSVSGRSPANEATGVAPDTNITLQVSDSGEGVDISTVVMNVEGIIVSPTIVGSPASYTLSYNPSVNFIYDQVVNISIDAKDLAEPANIMAADSYSFSIESTPSPASPPPSDGDTEGGGGGTTPPPPADTVSPIITEIAVSEVSAYSAIISWKTNEPSTSQINYGISEDYRLFSPVNYSLTTAHSVKIEGLKPWTKYYFKAISEDAAKNRAVSSGGIITTPGITGDLNKDGKVDVFDLSIMFSNWKKSAASYDLTGDNTINIFDLSLLLSNWTK